MTDVMPPKPRKARKDKKQGNGRTAEQNAELAAKARAAYKAKRAAATFGTSQPDAADADQGPREEIAGAAPWVAYLPGRNDYDPAIARGMLPADAVKREQIFAEQLNNEKLRVQLEQARGNLVTKEDHQDTLAALRGTYDRALGNLVPSLVAMLRTEGMAPDEISTVKTAAERCLAQIQSQIAGAAK